MATTKKDPSEMTVEEKLKLLFQLQGDAVGHRREACITR